MLTKLFVPIQATILRNKIVHTDALYFESNNTSKIYMKTFIYFSIEKKLLQIPNILFISHIAHIFQAIKFDMTLDISLNLKKNYADQYFIKSLRDSLPIQKPQTRR